MLNEKKKLVLISLNELNFDAVKLYELKDLSNLKKLVSNANLTSSEKDYEKLEPWIQWLTIYSGMTADEHGVFRLGDVKKKKIENIFNKIEKLGFQVGAISPMNLDNNLKSPNFFIPDPWTDTCSDESFFSKLCTKTFSKFVNNNSSNKVEFKYYIYLLTIFFKFFRFKNLFTYLELLFRSINSKYYKVVFFDILLNDIFIKLKKSKNTSFSHLFLNGIAHIQHHYFFNSKINNSKNVNPDWYINKKIDPFFNILKYYDKILNDYLINNDEKIMIATGLTQIPYDRKKYYYRLNDHKHFLNKLKINYKEVFPRMSRDFLIEFHDNDSTLYAQNLIWNIKDKKNQKLFGLVENRGKELFITLNYSDEINDKSKFMLGDTVLQNIEKDVSLVAIKNGMHDPKGFFYISENLEKFTNFNRKEINIKDLHKLIINFFINEKN
ncbi:MAG: hypothetical protein CBC84_002385 [Pelagibacteraceae bacterium TMED124]|nr:hypothetical protein [Candidatus Neomarinimicrobiota bacterium]RPG17201.1 MAG: hypothetical protein CBC84_002385 [Pelagibacteraceae bacterium TMED124]|tara:strand:+ start:163 stop:1476 length:1314 start_codon:yes stop_codon:yes gene_type:complete